MEGGGAPKETTSEKEGWSTYTTFIDYKHTKLLGFDYLLMDMTWLTLIEKIFYTSKCAKDDKVEYATNLI